MHCAQPVAGAEPPPGSTPPPADEAKSDVSAPAREAKVEEEPAVVVEEAASTAEAPAWPSQARGSIYQS